MQNCGRREYNNLNLIKIIASILIMLHHYQQMFNFSLDGINFFGGKYHLGLLVELFFLISGFLTINSTFDMKNKNYIIIFVKKITRLYPTVVISVIYTLFVHKLYFIITDDYLYNQIYSLKNIISSCLLVFGTWGIQLEEMGVNNPTWYLCVLIVCILSYLAIDYIDSKFKINNVLSHLIVLLLSLVMFVIERKYAFLENIINCRGFISFYLGILIWDLKNIDFLKIKKWKNIVRIVCITVLVYIIGLYSFSWQIQRLLVTFIIWPILLLFAIDMPQIKSKMIDYMAKASFEVYVWHLPLIYTLMAIINIMKIEYPHTYFTMLCFVIINYVFSIIMYKMVERPLCIGVAKKCNILSKRRNMRTGV